ncbi:hypothetical protein ACFQZQ_03025 [Lysobacter koreensis]|uniref:Major facilitator superfamily (MFS) profile domain-containing protein n=1 Tax=Lysobacter koreensis TaxID=266122 RepID=A0ABW2YJ89_9GAMM
MNWAAFLCVLGGFAVLMTFCVVGSIALGWLVDAVGPLWGFGILFGAFGLGAAIVAGLSG